MKKCPKCKAEIQEEARFCLYCMTSFEEKQTIERPKEIDKRWMIIIAAVLVLIFIILSIFLFTKKDNSTKGENHTLSNSSISSDLDAFDDNNTTSSEQQNIESQDNETSTPTSSNQTQTTSKNEGNTTNSTSGNTATNNSSSGTSTNNTTNNTSENTKTNNTFTNSSSQNNNTTSNTTTNNASTNNTTTSSTSSTNKTENNNFGGSSTTTPPEITTITYTYRDAVPADDYTASTTITNNAVVITGVKNVSDSGIYEIPATIDGKKVVAIMDNAFCEDEIKDTVKQVIIPSTVKTINAYAFYKCYNLTDIYINGEAVACPSVIIPNKSNRNFEITIHASSACHDRNFHTYKTLSTYWEVNFKEWNG